MPNIQTDMKRALTSWGFWVCAAGIAVAPVIAAFNSFLSVAKGAYQPDAGFHAAALLSALSSDTVLFAFPVLCGIVHTSSFADDVMSGFVKFYQPRIGRKRYVATRALVTALSGGLAPLIGVLTAYLLFLAFFGPREARAAGDAPGFGEVLPQAILFFLSGSFWALVGQLFSCLTMNRYVAYASPFLFYYVLVILTERYWKDAFLLNPKNWFDLSGAWQGGVGNAALFFAGIGAAAGVLFGIAAVRRLSYE